MDSPAPKNPESQSHWEEVPTPTSRIPTVLGVFAIVVGIACLVASASSTIERITVNRPFSGDVQTFIINNFWSIFACVNDGWRLHWPNVPFAEVGITCTILGLGMLRLHRGARNLLIVLCSMAAARLFIVEATHTVGMLTTNFRIHTPEHDDFIFRSLISLLIALLVTFILGAVTYLCLRPAVRKAFEKKNQRTSWTEACPLPVLAIVAWLPLEPINTLLALLDPKSNEYLVASFMGAIPGGVPLQLGLAANAAVAIAIAWGLYKGKRAAWIALLAFVSLEFAMHCSTRLAEPEMWQAAINNMNNDLQDAYSITARDLTFDFIKSLPYLVFVVWLGRYFRGKKAAPTTPTSAART